MINFCHTTSHDRSKFFQSNIIRRNVCILEQENEFQSSKVRYEMPDNFKHQQTEANVRP